MARGFARIPLVFYRKNRHRRRLRSTSAEVIEIDNANTRDARRLIRSYSPDVLLSAAYPQILGKGMLKIAHLGSVNFHPSPLPRFRGAHPHYWCLATGAQTGGVTAHFMTREIDLGDIISQRTFDLTELYYADLYDRIVEETSPVVKEVAAFFRDPDARSTPQDESLATLFKADRDIHHWLDFSTTSAGDLLNRIRAGRAYTHHRGARIGIARARTVDTIPDRTNSLRHSPGEIVDIAPDGIAVATIDDGYLIIETVVIEGRDVVSSLWHNRTKLRVGETLA